MQGYHFSHPAPAEAMERMLRESRTADWRQREGKGEGPTLLLLDDEPLVLSALSRSLQRDGYHILLANTPAEAFDLLARNPVAVVVSDQRMPDMEGTESLRRVRSLHPQTVRIMLTAHLDSRTMTQAINEGAIYKFVAKPWDDVQMRECLAEAVRRAKSHKPDTENPIPG